MSCLLGLITLIFLGLWHPVHAQESPLNISSPAPSGSEWWFGPAARQDGLGYDSLRRQVLSGESLLGLQVQHRMDPWFSSGGSLLFSQQDSAILLNLDVRWYWPLSLAEPYLGLELSYLTRDNGGLATALRSGFQIQFAPQFQMDTFGLLRYDLFKALFVSSPNDVLLYGGIGLALLWQIGG